ncbi:MAG: T9SS type A sorting domain-containing protein [Bacteroidota bacterium]|nr:T9SS type A sorting domain-containing protein [Bacteroidota bacterium]
MRMFPLFSVLLVLALVLPAAAQPVLNVKRTEVQWPDIHVYYDIQCNGQLDLSHTINDFTLREDGIPVPPAAVSCPDTTAHCPPSVTLVLDASASVVGQWHVGLVKAGNAFIDKMDGVTDEAAVVYFNSSVIVQQGMTTQKAPLRTAINGLFPVGNRAMFDGAHAGITQTASAASNACRAVVLATNGTDNQSSYNEADVIALARATNVRVITLGLGSTFDAASLQRIADSTGGAFYPVLDTLNISTAFREVFEFISDGFRECRLTYRSDCPDGAQHELRIDVAGICGGSASHTLKFHKPQLPTQMQILDLLPGVTEGFEGQLVTVPVMYSMLQPGVLQPSDIIITFPEVHLQLQGITIPSLSPLSGSGVDIVPYAGNYLLSTRDAIAVGIGGPFLNLEFYIKERVDSISLQIQPVNVLVSKGCVRPVFHPGSINVAVAPQPEIEALGAPAFCPGDSVVLRTTREYDAYFWTTGDTTRSIVASDSGNYAVSVMDYAGRTALSPLFHVEVYPGANPELSSEGMFALCAGRTLDLQTTQPFAQYRWSTGDTTASITITDAGAYSVSVTDANGCTGGSDTLFVTLDDPVVTVQPADTALLCAGSVAVLTATPGFAQYRWSNGRSGQQLAVTQPGRYAVMVTNAAGCTAVSDTVLVVAVPSPVADISTTGPMTLCPGDSLLLDGGADFLGWAWSTGATTRYVAVRDTGTYWLRVTAANGCVSPADSVHIAYTQRPVLDPSGTFAFCHGEELTIDAGAGYVQYFWNTGETTRTITADTSGRFWADVIDAGGCQLRTDTTEVFFRPEVRPEITADGPLTFCEGDSVVLEAPLGYAGYHWSSGETVHRIVVRDAGSYSVEVFTRDGCDGRSDEVVVTVLPLPQKPVITRQGSTLTAPLAEDYRWYHNGVEIPGVRTRQLGVTQNGMYVVEVFNAEGCSRKSDPLEVIIVGIATLPSSFSVDAWPDPNRGVLHVAVTQPAPGPLHISVVNLLGQQVAASRLEHAQGSDVHTLDLGAVPAGLYLLRVQTAQRVFTRRIIRQ